MKMMTEKISFKCKSTDDYLEKKIFYPNRINLKLDWSEVEMRKFTAKDVCLEWITSFYFPIIY